MGLPRYLEASIRSFSESEYLHGVMIGAGENHHCVTGPFESGQNDFKKRNKQKQADDFFRYAVRSRNAGSPRFWRMHSSHETKPPAMDSCRVRILLGYRIDEEMLKFSGSFTESCIGVYLERSAISTSIKAIDTHNSKYEGGTHKVWFQKAINEYGLKKYLNRTFSSRSFPPKLKNLIFHRDDFTCQHCLRDKQKLFSLGLSLEVDHIVEWEDGGKTCYKNGETICSECNTGKHHAKNLVGCL